MRWAAISGTAVLAALWVLPLDLLIGRAFPVHMLRHMGLVAVAAPLLVLGLPRLTALFGGAPLLAAAAEFAVVWGWHLPLLHGWARTTHLGFAAEQASFLLVGLAVWAGALTAPPLAGAGVLLLTSMHMTALGALLTLAQTDVYFEICRTAPDLIGQQAGGLLMLVIGTPIYLLAGLARVAGTLREQPA
ncbi:cytochrome c oxidase assembly protein [uncultured Jannaschia sp.]|uniref:cytochrome c oxidase assembly protein n=1 Tax=uncultured Jannaschia sp. TaxID=293347 RepID=UPI002602166A|nr:cytochrome c oxidase assembly protein [uncultured Jannaschia sp.]